MSRPDYDVAILGAGLAGLSLAVRLAEPQFAGMRVLVVDRRTSFGRDRTWSYWALRPHPFAAAVAASWDRWAVIGDGREAVRHAPGLRYETIPADALYRVALDRLRAAPHIDLRLGVTADAAESSGAVQIQLGADTVRATMAFDTRPAPELGRHGLTQRFLGQEIETERSVFDPTTATLMDFRCAQSGAAHFTYVLPTTDRRITAAPFATIWRSDTAWTASMCCSRSKVHCPWTPCSVPVPGAGCSRLAHPAEPTGPARGMRSTPSRRVAT